MHNTVAFAILSPQGRPMAIFLRHDMAATIAKSIFWLDDPRPFTVEAVDVPAYLFKRGATDE